MPQTRLPALHAMEQRDWMKFPSPWHARGRFALSVYQACSGASILPLPTKSAVMEMQPVLHWFSFIAKRRIGPGSAASRRSAGWTNQFQIDEAIVACIFTALHIVGEILCIAIDNGSQSVVQNGVVLQQNFARA